MIQGIITKIIAGIVTVVLVVSGLLGFVHKSQLQLGTTIPIVVALFETSLATKISSTATSMTLTTGTDKDGNALSGTYGFVIDEGTASEEFVTASCTATACTSMLRGISVVTGNTEITALKKTHRRGASIKISNHPQLAVISRILNGDETVPNKLTYASLPSITANEDIITKKYADDLSYAGVADATTTAKGIIELATTAEVIAGTATGSTGAALIAPNSLFDATFSATTIVPVTGTDGKLAQGFLDLTESYTWTGSQTFSGTTSIGGTPIFTAIPTLPDSDPTTANQATRKSYVDQGLENKFKTGYTFKAINNTDDQTIAHGLGVTPRLVRITANTKINSYGALSVGTATSTTSEQCISLVGITATNPAPLSTTSIIFLQNDSFSTEREANVKTLDSTNIILEWTTNSNNGGSTNIIWEAYY